MKILRTFGLLLVLAAVGTLMSGCGKSVSGTYVDDTGMFSAEFKSGGKVSLKMGGIVAQEADYTVEGDKVVVKSGGQSIEMKIKDDGSLDARPAMGTLKKK
jgi:hypothetical protein